MSGLTLASHLAGRGHEVTVFEKARGPGGRMSTRREGDLEFDHGAQYFTVGDDRFAEAVVEWEKQGIVQPWRARVVGLDQRRVTTPPREKMRYVAVHRMNAICRHLAAPLDVKLRMPVKSARRHEGGWRLIDSDDRPCGQFGLLAITIPPEQAIAFLGDAPEVTERVRAARMAPCWAVMAAFERSLGADWDAAFVSRSPLSWIARNSSKPGRPAGEMWVMHASPEWSLEHLELGPEAVVERLTDALFDATGMEHVRAELARPHRWRYARAENAITDGCIWVPSLGLGVCGDWCRGSRVEDAFLSGLLLADYISR